MDTQPTPPPKLKATPLPPSKPQASMVESTRAELAKGKPGFHPLRPLRYLKAFIGGTIMTGLNEMAKYGRFGAIWGLIGGLILGIAAPVLAELALGGAFTLGAGAMATLTAIATTELIPIVMACTLGALAIGAAVGAAHGVLTGGMRAFNREHRRDKYAEDLIQRSTVRKTAPINRADYRHAYRSTQQQNGGGMTLQILEREAEKKRDEDTYWQDREHRTSNGMSRF